jgi:uncharacterized membrane protein YedE/YeeE
LDWLIAERWSPYAAGFGIGILVCLTFLLSDKAIGCTTAYARTSGMLERLFRGERALERPYFKAFRPEVDWEWMLVVGIVIGSFLSALLSGRFHVLWVPESWSAMFGTSVSLRLVTALMGGILMGFGSRWAGGCTSGHGISGTLQLAVSSWLATICFFIGGVITAFLVY